MVHAINPTLRSITGYSFSLSNISRNVSKIALSAIILVVGVYVTVSAKCIPEHFDCQLSCHHKPFPPFTDAKSVRFYCTADKCRQICESYFH